MNAEELNERLDRAALMAHEAGVPPEDEPGGAMHRWIAANVGCREDQHFFLIFALCVRVSLLREGRLLRSQIVDALRARGQAMTGYVAEGFPFLDGARLSWSLSYDSANDERAGYPRLRAVVKAMLAERPEQLLCEHDDLSRARFGVFGANADRIVRILEEEAPELARG